MQNVIGLLLQEFPPCSAAGPRTQELRAVCSCASGCCSGQSTRSNSGQFSSRIKVRVTMA